MRESFAGIANDAKELKVVFIAHSFISLKEMIPETEHLPALSSLKLSGSSIVKIGAYDSNHGFYRNQ